MVDSTIINGDSDSQLPKRTGMPCSVEIMNWGLTMLAWGTTVVRTCITMLMVSLTAYSSLLMLFLRGT